MRKYDSAVRTKQAEQTKLEISDALDSLIQDNDIKSIPIKSICEAAGVSVGTFYIYFKNKEEALLYGYRKSDMLFNELIFPENLNNLEKLKHIIYLYIDMVQMDKVQNIRQVYIAHLTHFDDYFFSEQRPLLQKISSAILLCQSENVINLKYTNDELTIKLLRFIRGLLYDLSIRTNLIDSDNWKNNAYAEFEEYLTLFLI